MHSKVTGLFLSLAGAALNLALNRVTFAYDLPLHMDTVLTVSVTLAAGLFWGVVCGALTSIIYFTIWFRGWEAYLFTLCNIATAFITWLFIRAFPRELSFRQTAPPALLKSSRLNLAIGRIVVLMLLSFALCLAVSILGGFLAALILGFYTPPTGVLGISGKLSDTLFTYDSPLILVEIVSRIPINIIDRLIAALGGYGIALVLRGLAGRTGE